MTETLAHETAYASAGFTCIQVAEAAGLRRGRQSGQEQAFACPQHDDEHPSLMVNEAKDVWLCGPCGKAGNAWQLAAFIASTDPGNKPVVGAWLHEKGLREAGSDKGGAKSRIVATYPYQDVTGGLRYEVVRMEPGRDGRTKDFFQRRPDGNGGWINSLDGVQRVPYRLTELLRANYAFVVEGEKDVDGLRAIGLTATTMTGGTAVSGGTDGLRRTAEFAAFFKAHQHVTIIPDNDEPGRRHANAIAKALHGKVASIRILELPDLPHKGDVSDWLIANPEDAAAELSDLADKAPEWKQQDSPSALSSPLSVDDDGLSQPAFDLDLVIPAKAFVEMPLTPREDIICDVMFTQSANSVVGPRGLGKTRVVTTLGNAVSKGSAFFAWNTVRSRRFLLVDGELPAVDLKSIVYDHCDGSPSPFFDLIPSEFFSKQVGRPLTLSDREHQVKMVGLLDELERCNRRPDLIAFDNLSAMSFGLDENDNSAQDGLLQFLIDLRHRGYATLLVQHTGWAGEHARGASRREDFLDLSIALKPIAPGPVPTCRFKLEFSKVRRKPPSPLALECELAEGIAGRLKWTFRPTEGGDTKTRLAAASTATGEANLGIVLKVLTYIPRSSADIASLTGLSRSTVLEHLNTLKSRDQAATHGSGRNLAWVLLSDKQQDRLGRNEETC